MLWVYEHYFYSAGIDFSRQILTTKVDPRAVRVNYTGPAAQGLIRLTDITINLPGSHDFQ